MCLHANNNLFFSSGLCQLGIPQYVTGWSSGERAENPHTCCLETLPVHVCTVHLTDDHPLVRAR